MHRRKQQQRPPPPRRMPTFAPDVTCIFTHVKKFEYKYARIGANGICGHTTKNPSTAESKFPPNVDDSTKFTCFQPDWTKYLKECILSCLDVAAKMRAFVPEREHDPASTQTFTTFKAMHPLWKLGANAFEKLSPDDGTAEATRAQRMREHLMEYWFYAAPSQRVNIANQIEAASFHFIGKMLSVGAQIVCDSQGKDLPDTMDLAITNFLSRHRQSSRVEALSDAEINVELLRMVHFQPVKPIVAAAYVDPLTLVDKAFYGAQVSALARLSALIVAASAALKKTLSSSVSHSPATIAGFTSAQKELEKEVADAMALVATCTRTNLVGRAKRETDTRLMLITKTEASIQASTSKLSILITNAKAVSKIDFSETASRKLVSVGDLMFIGGDRKLLYPTSDSEIVDAIRRATTANPYVAAEVSSVWNLPVGWENDISILQHLQAQAILLCTIEHWFRTNNNNTGSTQPTYGAYYAVKFLQWRTYLNVWNHMYQANLKAFQGTLNEDILKYMSTGSFLKIDDYCRNFVPHGGSFAKKVSAMSTTSRTLFAGLHQLYTRFNTGRPTSLVKEDICLWLGMIINAIVVVDDPLAMSYSNVTGGHKTFCNSMTPGWASRAKAIQATDTWTPFVIVANPIDDTIIDSDLIPAVDGEDGPYVESTGTEDFYGTCPDVRRRYQAFEADGQSLIKKLQGLVKSKRNTAEIKVSAAKMIALGKNTLNSLRKYLKSSEAKSKKQLNNVYQHVGRVKRALKQLDDLTEDEPVGVDARLKKIMATLSKETDTLQKIVEESKQLGVDVQQIHTMENEYNTCADSSDDSVLATAPALLTQFDNAAVAVFSKLQLVKKRRTESWTNISDASISLDEISMVVENRTKCQSAIDMMAKCKQLFSAVRELYDPQTALAARLIALTKTKIAGSQDSVSRMSTAIRTANCAVSAAYTAMVLYIEAADLQNGNSEDSEVFLRDVWEQAVDLKISATSKYSVRTHTDVVAPENQNDPNAFDLAELFQDIGCKDSTDIATYTENAKLTNDADEIIRTFLNFTYIDQALIPLHTKKVINETTQGNDLKKLRIALAAVNRVVADIPTDRYLEVKDVGDRLKSTKHAAVFWKARLLFDYLVITLQPTYLQTAGEPFEREVTKLVKAAVPRIMCKQATGEQFAVNDNCDVAQVRFAYGCLVAFYERVHQADRDNDVHSIHRDTGAMRFNVIRLASYTPGVTWRQLCAAAARDEVPLPDDNNRALDRLVRDTKLMNLLYAEVTRLQALHNETINTDGFTVNDTMYLDQVLENQKTCSELFVALDSAAETATKCLNRYNWQNHTYEADTARSAVEEWGQLRKTSVDNLEQCLTRYFTIYTAQNAAELDDINAGSDSAEVSKALQQLSEDVAKSTEANTAVDRARSAEAQAKQALAAVAAEKEAAKQQQPVAEGLVENEPSLQLHVHDAVAPDQAEVQNQPPQQGGGAPQAAARDQAEVQNQPPQQGDGAPQAVARDQAEVQNQPPQQGDGAPQAAARDQAEVQNQPPQQGDGAPQAAAPDQAPVENVGQPQLQAKADAAVRVVHNVSEAIQFTAQYLKKATDLAHELVVDLKDKSETLRLAVKYAARALKTVDTQREAIVTALSKKPYPSAQAAAEQKNAVKLDAELFHKSQMQFDEQRNTALRVFERMDSALDYVNTIADLDITSKLWELIEPVRDYALRLYEISFPLYGTSNELPAFSFERIVNALDHEKEYQYTSYGVVQCADALETELKYVFGETIEDMRKLSGARKKATASIVVKADNQPQFLDITLPVLQHEMGAALLWMKNIPVNGPAPQQRKAIAYWRGRIACDAFFAQTPLLQPAKPSDAEVKELISFFVYNDIIEPPSPGALPLLVFIYKTATTLSKKLHELERQNSTPDVLQSEDDGENNNVDTEVERADLAALVAEMLARCLALAHPINNTGHGSSNENRALAAPTVSSQFKNAYAVLPEYYNLARDNTFDINDLHIGSGVDTSALAASMVDMVFKWLRNGGMKENTDYTIRERKSSDWTSCKPQLAKCAAILNKIRCMESTLTGVYAYWELRILSDCFNQICSAKEFEADSKEFTYVEFIAVIQHYCDHPTIGEVNPIQYRHLQPEKLGLMWIVYRISFLPAKQKSEEAVRAAGAAPAADDAEEAAPAAEDAEADLKARVNARLADRAMADAKSAGFVLETMCSRSPIERIPTALEFRQVHLANYNPNGISPTKKLADLTDTINGQNQTSRNSARLYWEARKNNNHAEMASIVEIMWTALRHAREFICDGKRYATHMYNTQNLSKEDRSLLDGLHDTHGFSDKLAKLEELWSEYRRAGFVGSTSYAVQQIQAFYEVAASQDDAAAADSLKESRRYAELINNLTYRLKAMEMPDACTWAAWEACSAHQLRAAALIKKQNSALESRGQKHENDEPDALGDGKVDAVKDGADTDERDAAIATQSAVQAQLEVWCAPTVAGLQEKNKEELKKVDEAVKKPSGMTTEEANHLLLCHTLNTGINSLDQLQRLSYATFSNLLAEHGPAMMYAKCADKTADVTILSSIANSACQLRTLHENVWQMKARALKVFVPWDAILQIPEWVEYLKVAATAEHTGNASDDAFAGDAETLLTAANLICGIATKLTDQLLESPFIIDNAEFFEKVDNCAKIIDALWPENSAAKRAQYAKLQINDLISDLDKILRSLKGTVSEWKYSAAHLEDIDFYAKSGMPDAHKGEKKRRKPKTAADKDAKDKNDDDDDGKTKEQKEQELPPLQPPAMTESESSAFVQAERIQKTAAGFVNRHKLRVRRLARDADGKKAMFIEKAAKIMKLHDQLHDATGVLNVIVRDNRVNSITTDAKRLIVLMSKPMAYLRTQFDRIWDAGVDTGTRNKTYQSKNPHKGRSLNAAPGANDADDSDDESGSQRPIDEEVEEEDGNEDGASSTSAPGVGKKGAKVQKGQTEAEEAARQKEEAEQRLRDKAAEEAATAAEAAKKDKKEKKKKKKKKNERKPVADGDEAPIERPAGARRQRRFEIDAEESDSENKDDNGHVLARQRFGIAQKAYKTLKAAPPIKDPNGIAKDNERQSMQDLFGDVEAAGYTTLPMDKLTNLAYYQFKQRQDALAQFSKVSSDRDVISRQLAGMGKFSAMSADEKKTLRDAELAVVQARQAFDQEEGVFQLLVAADATKTFQQLQSDLAEREVNEDMFRDE